MEGVVKKIVSERGFGFISTGERKDVFFHHSAVAERQFDELTEGTRVTFDLDDSGDKGPRAVNVRAV